MTEILLSSSFLILLLALLRRLLRGRIDPRLQYGLWLLVALRLLIPGTLFTLPVSLADTAVQLGQSIVEALPAEDPTPERENSASTALPQEDAPSAVVPEENVSAAAPSGDTSPTYQEDAAAALGPAEDDGNAAPAEETSASGPFSLLTRLYDSYTETAEYPLDASQEQLTRDILDRGYFINGWQVDLEGGHQIVTYSRYASIWDMPFWRWPWYAGMAVMGCLLAATNLRFALALRKKRRRLSPDALPADCSTPVYLVEDLDSPCLCGLLRPAIYVNGRSLVPGRLGHILAHEQAHLRHGDHLWALLRMVILCVYWFDPFVWWAAVLSRRDGELACDHSAIRRLGEDQRLEYGQTLVDMIAPGRALPGLLRTATTMTDKKRTMKERILLIAKRPRMAIATLVLVLLSMTLASALAFSGSREASGHTGDSSTTQLSTQIAPGITQEEALALYEEARTVWNWFDLGTLPTTEEFLEADEATYFRVEGFDSLSELRDYLLTLFSPELTDRLLTGYQLFQETAEGLFVQPAQRGSGIYAGEETLQVFLMTAEEAEQYGYDGHIYETREVLDEDLATVLYHKRHDWFFLWNGSHYVFTSFGPSDDGDPQLYYNAVEIMAAIQRGDAVPGWLPLLLNMDGAALAAAGGDDFDLSMAVLDALHAYAAEQGQAMTENDYWYVLSACQGLDGAYAEGYQATVWLLYQAQPQQFASVAINRLTAEQQAQILDFFRWEYSQREGNGAPMTAEEALALLRQELPPYTLLTSADYVHSSGMFSLTLPEEWVGKVAYTETTDSVSFYEAVTFAAYQEGASEADGLLLTVEPQPADYAAGSAQSALAAFDCNGTAYVYQACWPQVQAVLEGQEDAFLRLWDQRDQLRFQLLATETLISRLVYRSCADDLSTAITYLPYLSWSSYRTSYGNDGLSSLLSALRTYAESGQATWDEYHDILSAPVDEAIDGAYAAAYQDVLWALYHSAPDTFASVVGSAYLSETERDNAVYWLRQPLAEEMGRSEALSEEEVRALLGLRDEGEASGGEDLPSMPGEMMNGFMRGWAPVVTSLGDIYPVTATVYDDWSLASIAQAIQASLAQSLEGTRHEGQLSDVAISYTFSLPSTARSGDVLEVPYHAIFTTVYTVEGYAPEEFTLSGGPFTAQVTLAGDGTPAADSGFLDGQAVYRQLESCTQGIELEAVSGGSFDLAASIQDAIQAKLEAAGLAGDYTIAALSLGSYTQPASLSPGQSQSVSGSVHFIPATENSFLMEDIDFTVTCHTVAG